MAGQSVIQLSPSSFVRGTIYQSGPPSDFFLSFYTTTSETSQVFILCVYRYIYHHHHLYRFSSSSDSLQTKKKVKKCNLASDHCLSSDDATVFRSIRSVVIRYRLKLSFFDQLLYVLSKKQNKRKEKRFVDWWWREFQSRFFGEGKAIWHVMKTTRRPESYKITTSIFPSIGFSFFFFSVSAIKLLRSFVFHT